MCEEQKTIITEEENEQSTELTVPDGFKNQSELDMCMKEIHDKERELFHTKNTAYQSSFFAQLEEDGLALAGMRLTDKLQRFKALIKNPSLATAEEGIKDTLIDLANYANMTLLYLDKRCQ